MYHVSHAVVSISLLGVAVLSIILVSRQAVSSLHFAKPQFP